MAASSAVSSAIGQPTDQQVERLAAIFRTSRLTVLLGDDAPVKTALLKTSLLPLLSRRAGDRTLAGIRREGGVIYLPERRKETALRDVVIYFDDWDDRPLLALNRRIDAVLVERFGRAPDTQVPGVACGWLSGKLAEASRRSGLKFLIVLDAFDTYLAAAGHEPGIAQFADELIEALDTFGLAANFLVVLGDEAEPAFERIRSRLVDQDGAGLRLSSPHLHDVERVSTPAIASEPWPPLAEPDVDPVSTPQVGIKALVLRRPVVVMGLVVAVLAAIVFSVSRGTAPSGAFANNARAIEALATNWKSRAIAAVAAGPSTPPRAVFAMPVDADDGIDARIVEDLRNRVARNVGIDLRVRPATRWDDAFTARTESPQLAILRYDALQAARGRAVQPLQIVTPLYTENILVLARRGAPIAFVHEIEGLRINVGPASGARGLTATRLYQDLFGKALPADRAQADGIDTALGKLVEDRGVDAVVIAGTDLAALFADKPAAWKARVKLLQLDRAHPSTRRAQRFFLPSVARADASGGLLDQDLPTLAEMAFLVTSSPFDDAHLAELARSLCAGLPALQRDGDPKWREVRLGTRFDVGWPYASAAIDAFRNCPATPDAVASAHPQP